MQSPSDDPLHDGPDLESLLQLTNAPPAAEHLRRSLYEQTTTALRSQRRNRRAALALGFATAYAAGLLTALGFTIFGFTASDPAVTPGPHIADRSAPAGTEESAAISAPARPSRIAAAQPSQDTPSNAQPQPQSVARTTGSTPPAAIQQPAFPVRPRAFTPPPPRTNRAQQRTRYESLRELGDHYLLQLGDPEGAVRCYRLAWKSATDDEKDTQSGTWLYRALVRDLETEQTHERQDG